MPSTTQTFAGAVAKTGDEVVVKHTGTIYPCEIIDIDTETDTPIVFVLEDDVGQLSDLVFADVPPEGRELEPDGTWFWATPPIL